MTTDARFARQICLPEVGQAGQARLLGAECVISGELSELAQQTAETYARLAGLLARTLPQGEPLGVPFPQGEAFVHARSREFARGAHLALASIRQALELGEGRPQVPPSE